MKMNTVIFYRIVLGQGYSDINVASLQEARKRVTEIGAKSKGTEYEGFWKEVREGAKIFKVTETSEAVLAETEQK